MDISYYKKYEPIFGSWHIVREIGEGSFGKVFEIERNDFGQTYKAALKAITIPQNESELKSSLLEFDENEESVTSYYEGIVEEVVSEFALMSRLKGHSNIVSYEDHAVYRHGEGIGWDILIRMELLTPLLDYMRSNEMDRETTVRLGIDMCKALEQCKKQDIIHRDIKPENIFVSEFGDFKLGDFGIARVAEKTTGGMSKKGTYAYMAPEVYKGEAYGAGVDIYSLGLVLYRLLNSNRTPFLPQPPEPIKPSARESALMRRLRGEEIPAPAKADAELAAVILKACAYNPKDRFSSPTEMRKALEALLTGSSRVQPSAVYAEATAVTEATAVISGYSADTVVASADETVCLKGEGTAVCDAHNSTAAAFVPGAVPQSRPVIDSGIKPPVQPPKQSRPVGKNVSAAFTARKAISIVLLAAWVLSLVIGFFCAGSITDDNENIKSYTASDYDTASDGVAQLEDGLALLKENEQTYLDGVETYVAGREQLDAGQAQLAEGQAMIDANTQAYLEGKEQIAKMESLMPAIEGMASAVQNVRDFNAGVIDGDADMYLGQLRANVLNFLANGQAVATLSDLVGMDISGILASNPTDTAVIGNVINMYYDGLAQLKQYENGLAQLADGRAQLAEGEKQLAEGAAQLSQFEDGERQIADGIMQLLLGMGPAYRQKSFEQTVDSLAERLAEELDVAIPALYNERGFNQTAYAELCNTVLDNMFQKNENGDYICAQRDGTSLPLLDLDKCGLIVDKAEEYLEDSTAAVDAELLERNICAILTILAAVIGITAATTGVVSAFGGKRTGNMGISIAAAVMAVAAIVFGFACKLNDCIFGVRLDEAGRYSTDMFGTVIQYSNGMSVAALVIAALAAAAALGTIIILKAQAKER